MEEFVPLPGKRLHNPKTVAIVQARMGSTRLPGKVLTRIHGVPMLARVIDRIRMARRVDQIVVAIPDTLRDRPLFRFCEQQNVMVVAGSEYDVLARFVETARQSSADQIVRITADCPLIDPDIIDDTISVLQGDPDLDYVSNIWPVRNYPRGLDAEAFTLETLHRIDEIANATFEREHVTLGIYQRPHLFRIGSCSAPCGGSGTVPDNYGHLRWTVDTAADLQLVENIYRHFDDRNFRWHDVIDAYRRFPHWNSINQHIVQKAA